MMLKSIDTLNIMITVSLQIIAACYHWITELVSKRVYYGRSVDKSIGYTLLDHNNQEIAMKRKDTVKDLGVCFDEKLLFLPT